MSQDAKILGFWSGSKMVGLGLGVLTEILPIKNKKKLHKCPRQKIAWSTWIEKLGIYQKRKKHQDEIRSSVPFLELLGRGSFILSTGSWVILVHILFYFLNLSFIADLGVLLPYEIIITAGFQITSFISPHICKDCLIFSYVFFAKPLNVTFECLS